MPPIASGDDHDGEPPPGGSARARRAPARRSPSRARTPDQRGRDHARVERGAPAHDVHADPRRPLQGLPAGAHSSTAMRMIGEAWCSARRQPVASSTNRLVAATSATAWRPSPRGRGDPLDAGHPGERVDQGHLDVGDLELDVAGVGHDGLQARAHLVPAPVPGPARVQARDVGRPRPSRPPSRPCRAPRGRRRSRGWPRAPGPGSPRSCPHPLRSSTASTSHTAARQRAWTTLRAASWSGRAAGRVERPRHPGGGRRPARPRRARRRAGPPGRAAPRPRRRGARGRSRTGPATADRRTASSAVTPATAAGCRP